MNTNSKSGIGPPVYNKKKPGRPRNESDLNNIAIRPPVPPAPALNEIQYVETESINRIITPTLRSPIDQTPIIINGRVVDLESEIEERIEKSSPVIRPVTPPPQPSMLPPLAEQRRTPPSLPMKEVIITETPPETPTEFPNEDIEEEDREIEEEEKNEVAQDTEPSKIPYNKYPNYVKVETLPNKPLNFTSFLEEDNKSTTTTSSYVSTPSSESPDSVDLTDSSKKQYPFDFAKALNLVGSKDSDDEDEGPNLEFLGNSQFPSITGRIRVDSPIETMGGPSSPPPRPKDESKPMFTDHGKSYTPRRVTASPVLNKTSPKVINNIRDDVTNAVKNIIQPSPRNISPKQASPIRPGMVPSPRAKTPPPMQRTSPPRQQQIQGPAMFFPPQQNAGQHSMFGGRPDYSKLTLDQQVYMRSEFKVKFGILRSSYPQWGIQDPDDRMTLDQVHDIYEYYIRQIIISKETGQYKVYLLIFFMFVEVVGVKLLKLNMSGYTMSQLKIMNRYDSLLAELGEKWLISSGSDWPVEARLLMMATFNAVIFIAVRYLCGWMGVEGLADNIQNVVDNMLNGPSATAFSAPGMPERPPTPTPAMAASQSTGNPLDGLAGAFSGLFGGGNNGSSNSMGGLTEGIAKLGTMFTSKIQQANQTAKANPPKQATNTTNKSGGRQKLDKRTLFG